MKNQNQAGLQAELQALMSRYGVQMQVNTIDPQGISIPVEIDVPNKGTVTFYLSYNPEVLQNPIQLIAGLESQGYRIKTNWKPDYQRHDNYNNQGGYNNNQGYNNYNRGGGYNRYNNQRRWR